MSLLRKVTDFILQSRSRAFGVAFVCAYLPLLGSISILIAGLVTLRKGAWEGALILVAATVPFFLSYAMATPQPDQVEMAQIALLALVISNVLVWMYAVILRKYNNWSLVLELSVLLSIVIIGIVHLINPEIQAWWGTQLTAYFTKATAEMSRLPNTDIKMQLQAIDMIKPFATGLVILSIILNGLLQLVLARWWEVIIFAPGTLRKELYQIRFGYVVGVLFVVVLLLSLWGSATALDMKPVFYGLFFIAGISLAHCLLAKAKYGWFWLMFMYIAFILLFPKSMMIIAVFALLDVLLDFRRRLGSVKQ